MISKKLIISPEEKQTIYPSGMALIMKDLVSYLNLINIDFSRDLSEKDSRKE